MSDSNEAYMRLITSEYAEKPKFNSYAAAFLDMVSPSVDCLNKFNLLFSLKTAVGDQLDKLGALVALSRELPVDDADIPAILPDSLFRIVIKARIYSNFWDGTLSGWNNLLKEMFPDAVYEIVDNQDMSVNIVMIDPSATSEMIALLFNGYLVPTPAGVRVTWTIQDKALFGWDAETGFIEGWDKGLWSNT